MRRDRGTAAATLPIDIEPAASVASVALPVISSASTAEAANDAPMAAVVGITEPIMTAVVRRWTAARLWVRAEVSAVIGP